ncbi:segregation/condensation protein A [Mycoplasma anserisalpingitidis]|uniref:Segregation and condensation protein A n=1 Tax=Mycoplasma anserisalpingitidis TaxID=519450 RepID=A0A5B8JXF4_9MOLU|nr:segregation/condensation protein A [Mycoplasma anserisalpingitidis]QDY87041.1 segregation/condensation protein A [Mycoplasma anserisalpingitidis]QDY88744.1 segregation/condensation protein A [Mycoplasma anserisalpingitidis]UCU26632.1 segregation/condensation protein A [Mycoplasma anserisalpingitidis]UCU27470.1 segregation/condensation protein A [Mycoplasma anserisalpingitidis]
MDNFDIKLDDFDGPLDLLLSLVQDKKISVFEINMAELATQYLQIINNLKDSDINIASEYLVMAATLIQLKSKLLLNSPEEKEEVEIEKSNLLQQILEYKQFKEVSKTLKEKEELRDDIFIKEMSNLDQFILEKDNSKLDGTSNPVKLIMILRKMFERRFAQKLALAKLDTFKLTPKDQEGYIKNIFDNYENVTFDQIFNLPSLNHFVITLLALLDMARRQIIIIEQDEQFAELRFKRGPEYER